MEIIDMTHSIHQGMAVFPGDPETMFKKYSGGVNSFCVHSVTLGTHTGTHIDSPVHIDPSGIGIDHPDIFKASAGMTLFIRVNGFSAGNKIGIDSISHQLKNIDMAERIVLMTNWSKKIGAQDYYLFFPSVSTELADFLMEKKISLIGTESPSISAENDMEIHRKFLNTGTIIVENLSIPSDFPEGFFFFSAAPIKLRGLDGAPVRAFAVTEF